MDVETGFRGSFRTAIVTVDTFTVELNDGCRIEVTASIDMDSPSNPAVLTVMVDDVEI